MEDLGVTISLDKSIIYEPDGPYPKAAEVAKRLLDADGEWSGLSPRLILEFVKNPSDNFLSFREELNRRGVTLQMTY